MNNHKLPPGWVWTTLGESCEVIMGQSPPSSTYNNEGVGLPFYQGKAEFGDLYPIPVKWCSQPGKIAEANDVLISVRAPVGPTNLCQEKSCIGRGLAAIRPEDQISNLYILYWLRYIENEWESKATGTTFKAISGFTLREQYFALPPLPEQKRIVDEIEAQFTRLDAGIASVKRAQIRLHRYRAAVLKATCEGKLVPQDPTKEPASVLLERILAERRQKWEAEQIAQGKDPAKLIYPEPASPDQVDLPELPRGWVWTTWEQLSPRVTVGFVGPMKHEYVEDGIKFLRSQNVRENRFDPQGLMYISPEFHRRLSKSALGTGDLVVVRSGSVGVTCVIPEGLDETNCADLVIIKKPFGLISEFGSFYMNSLAKRRIRAGQVGIALTHFNTKSVAALPVPLPPIAEQQRIVEEVERRLSVVEEVEAAIETNLKRAERLRQSILKRAFEGKLVPQDPNDEPASVLLERIKAKRVRREAANGRNSGRAAKQLRLLE